MGQRIAAQRKLKGLNQEALSEQLDVSRQAISKWESDGAIPEVDKLIALGRIFGVSVGWLLGTEAESRGGPEAGLSAAQEKQVAEIAARYQPARIPWWKRLLAAVCVLAIVITMTVYYQRRIDELSADNATTQTQLAQLAQANQDLQTRLDAMNELLEKQDSAGKLLSNYGITGCYASEDMQNVTMTFVLTPKVYQEAVSARLSVSNPDGYSETLDCWWNGVQYLVRVTVPLADDYQFRFLLAGQDSYQEESLNDRDPALSALKTHAAFSLSPEAQTRAIWAVSDRTYTFSSPLLPPIVLPRIATTYQDIVFTLYRNDEAIWSGSWKEEFLNAYGAQRAYALPVTPDISVELPELAVGDKLRLEITAQLYEGQVLTTVLDDLTVTE